MNIFLESIDEKKINKYFDTLEEMFEYIEEIIEIDVLEGNVNDEYLF